MSGYVTDDVCTVRSVPFPELQDGGKREENKTPRGLSFKKPSGGAGQNVKFLLTEGMTPPGVDDKGPLASTPAPLEKVKQAQYVVDRVSRSTGATTGRPNITPDHFDGKTSWKDYRRHFEACKLANNGWNDYQAAVF